MTGEGTENRERGTDAPHASSDSRFPIPDSRQSVPGSPRPPEAGTRPVPIHRVGIGYDSHRFAPGGPIILGGCRIPSDVSLVGHSDGDAVAHAITDAILGAAALGDIGEMFADTDPQNRGRDSIEMLQRALARVDGAGWRVANVDVTVVAERPKVGPHRDAMRSALARALAIDVSAVSVKGKTNEGMGWIGRTEGLACMAIASLVPRDQT